VVTVAGRDVESAKRVVREAQRGVAASWSDLGGPHDLIVNATSAGMEGGEDGSPIAEAWDRAGKTSATVAYDLIYRPRETLFLERARTQGHRAIHGLGMLVEQGARALSIFIGTPIDLSVKRAMREAIEGEGGGRPDAR
jgi:shikimate 5-dehydrogenase